MKYWRISSWFRSYVRAKHFINPEYAAMAKNRLALLYAFCAWNVFGYVIVRVYNEKVPKVHDSVDYAKVLGVKDSKVVKISNFSVVDQYELNLSDKELTDFTEIIGNKEDMEKYNEENEKRIRAAQEKEKEKQTITNS